MFCQFLLDQSKLALFEIRIIQDKFIFFFSSNENFIDKNRHRVKQYHVHNINI